MKAFIDISSDKIGIYGLGNPIFLNRNGVELGIGKVLVELNEKYGFTECYVLNGPGGFTNLRVGTLALNLLKTLKDEKTKFYSISKPELYSIFFKNGWIPRYGILYIGQKSNVWLRDTENNHLIEMIKKSEIKDFINKYGDIYLDQVYDESYFNDLGGKLVYKYDEGNIILIFNGKHIIGGEELNKYEVERLEANYMIEPNVS